MVKIRIGALDYPVKWMDDDWKEDTNAEGVHYPQKELKIAINGSDPTRTLIHEVMHAISNQCCLRLKEEQIHPLAIMLTRALKDAKLLKDVMVPK